MISYQLFRESWIDILPALKNGDSYRATTRLSGVTSVGSCFYEAA